MTRILIATDAWHPQVSGVVRTIDTTSRFLREAGHLVEVVEPSAYPRVPVPFYPEIPLVCTRPGRVYDRVRRFRPDHVHIATEGPIGFLVRRYCLLRHWRFTTSYHTRFPEYLKELVGIPPSWTYGFLRWFHRPAAAMMVSTSSLEAELTARGFRPPIRRWSRGVDLGIFHPRPRREHRYPRPVLLYVGRLSAEKGVEEFLRLPITGTKLIVGDGPSRPELQAKHPDAVFLGYKRGNELGDLYATADLFVFPSRTDTFGIVLIEALASGLPVAAHPATGPIDIITRPELGSLDNDLEKAIKRALLTGDRAECAKEGRLYTWDHCTRQFAANLVPTRLEMR